MRTPMKNVPENYFHALDSIRDSGVVNMFGSAPYLMAMYPDISRTEAREIILAWIKSRSK